MQLGKEGALKLGSVRHFVLDECDKMLDKTGALFFPGKQALRMSMALCSGLAGVTNSETNLESCLWRCRMLVLKRLLTGTR